MAVELDGITHFYIYIFFISSLSFRTALLFSMSDQRLARTSYFLHHSHRLNSRYKRTQSHFVSLFRPLIFTSMCSAQCFLKKRHKTQNKLKAESKRSSSPFASLIPNARSSIPGFGNRMSDHLRART